MTTILYTVLALLAFAGNSVLCRLALGEGAIDAASFSVIRLVSGAAVLLFILKVIPKKATGVSKGSWRAALMLFLYAVTFSFAYVSLDTGTGALILFGLVQLTMIGASLTQGYRLRWFEWSGVALAFLGLVYLLLPSISTPPLGGFILMALSGVAWAGYTLVGRGSGDPMSDTAYNFMRCLPLVLVLLAVSYQSRLLSIEGVLLAILSGGLTSGIGYAIWYAALKGLTAIQASAVQLLVPLLAAFGGVVLINEPLSKPLILASVMILGGVLLVMLAKQYVPQR
ncbi:DMT family transporter [Shewanella algidipiscicola]|uniref:EamA domain-containing protein n=1 Tax=Shewanella algidipiscicola TaxID=614070 RepID=A0ABQ4P6Y6_9GAMM|nr:DMT family transporter [Shewanella algidipiscicola]GIU43299.1 hypothetical protein TUM4630_06280 [Shewanella algidipiscicola]